MSRDENLRVRLTSVEVWMLRDLAGGADTASSVVREQIRQLHRERYPMTHIVYDQWERGGGDASEDNARVQFNGARKASISVKEAREMLAVSPGIKRTKKGTYIPVDAKG